MQKDTLEEADARNKVYEDMKSAYRKTVMNNFMARMEWFCAIQQDPIYKAIKQTAASLIDIDYFDRSEAWKYAISKRKYLFDNILSEYDPPDVTKDVESESEQDDNIYEWSDFVKLTNCLCIEKSKHYMYMCIIIWLMYS